MPLEQQLHHTPRSMGGFRARGDDREATPALRAEWTAARSAAAAPGRGFLVADDDPDFRALVCHRLGRAFPGVPVHTAADGRDALAAIERLRPSLLMLDLDMPRMSGLELLDALYESGRTGRLPILVVSAACTRADWRLLVRLGADRLLVKPFRGTQLIEQARELVRGSADDGRTPPPAPGDSPRW